MKKLLYFGLAAVMAFGIVAMTGCGKDKVETSDSTTEATTETEATTTTEATTKEKTYKSLYLSKIDALADEYGSVNGGKLVDMDADGTQELVLFYGSVPNLAVEIFTVKNDEVVSLYSGKAGVRYGQTDASYQVWINESVSPSVVVTFDSTDEWENETIYATSISGGAASTEELKASTDGENDDPDRSWLKDWTINGGSVSQSEYNAEYERLKNGAEIIDPTASNLDSLRAELNK